MTNFEWVAFAIVAVLSAARLTRLLTFDDFPPVRWVRNWYVDKVDGTGWENLGFCGYCMSFWMASGVIAHGYYAVVLEGSVGGVTWAGAEAVWWLCHGILGGSYLAAVFMAKDGDASNHASDDSK